MGMYDSIMMKVKCPECDRTYKRESQTKDLGSNLTIFKVGDYIDNKLESIKCISDCKCGKYFSLYIELFEGKINGKYSYSGKDITNNSIGELLLIKLTLYSFAKLDKKLPKGLIFRLIEKDVLGLFKFKDGNFDTLKSSPVSFYFKDENVFELRSSYKGSSLLRISGTELNELIKNL